MKDDIVDLLFDGEILYRQNEDGTFSRCSPNELVGKDIEIVSSSRFSFQDLEGDPWCNRTLRTTQKVIAMTNEALIAKIKAEIERRKSLLTQHSKLTYDLILETFIKEYDDLLSFLSTLESEKPMNQDEVLNEEIKKEMANLPFFIRGKDQIAFARHFAKWGADHTPLPEDTVLFQKGVAEGKRLMMDEAVEGEIQMRYSGSLCAKTIRAINEDKFKLGDKVRIIIVKED